MRILLIGSDKHYAIENFYVKYLRQNGVVVDHYAAQSVFYNYYYQSIWNKIKYKLGFSKILNKINSEILELSANLRPDFVWVFKGMEILPETLVELKKRGAVLVNYNPDNPFIFSGTGSGNKNITQSIDLYDIHFTYSQPIKKALEKTTNAKIYFLPFGYDIDENLLKKVQDQDEVIKTCFLGNPDAYRADFIKNLAEKGQSIDVYGHGWSKFLEHPDITIFLPVYGDEFWFTLYKYRIQLNLMRPHNEDSHNMRTFEVPGVGGIQLAPRTPEHEAFFKENTEIFLFDNPDNCAYQIKKILALSKNEADLIRYKARQRCVFSGYSYKIRADYVASTLMSEFKSK